MYGRAEMRGAHDLLLYRHERMLDGAGDWQYNPSIEDNILKIGVIYGYTRAMFVL